jgi:hypothetical protein
VTGPASRLATRIQPLEVQNPVVGLLEPLVPLVERLLVDRSNPVPAVEELRDEMPPDEPARARDHGHPSAHLIHPP